jgi:hypothetical protein
MANVILSPRVGEPKSFDRKAFYVWASETGPEWGSWEAFAAGTPVRASFPDADWDTAISAAAAHADRAGLPTVYVVRNA